VINMPKPKDGKIKEGMSPKEVANVMSDRLMSHVDRALKSKKK